MKTVSVVAPEGTPWSVRVLWAPRWKALARRFGGWRSQRKSAAQDAVDGALHVAGDLPTSGGGGGGGGGDGGFDLGDGIVAILVVLVAFVAAAALFWWVLLPLLLVILDAAVILVLLVVSIGARVLFRRPWTVEATAPGRDPFVAHVVGWRAALRRRDDIADSLHRGLRPEVVPSPVQR